MDYVFLLDKVASGGLWYLLIIVCIKKDLVLPIPLGQSNVLPFGAMKN